MNQKIKLSKAIQYTIAGFALFFFLLIWPTGIIKDKEVSKSKEVQLQESDPISVENNGTQMFIAEGNYLDYVQLYVVNDMQSETITFRIYDSAYQQLWETFYIVDDRAKFPGFIRIEVDMEMEESWEYYYTVEGLTQDLILSYEDTNSSTSFANGTYLYGGEEMPGINIITRYIYTQDYSQGKIIIIGILLLTMILIIRVLTDWLFGGKWKEKDIEIKVQLLIQCIANPIIAILTVVSLWAVFPGRMFGTGILNYGFYYVGILLCAGVLLFGVNYKRTGQEPLMTKEYFSDHWQEWLMSVCFAGVLWYCYEYMNGLYDIHHEYATCRLLICFGLGILCTLKKKNLLNIWNVIYLIPACIAGQNFAKPYIGIPEDEDLYKLQAHLYVVLGLIMIHIIVSLVQIIRKKRKFVGKICIPYGICFLALLGLMIKFRNTREWPVLVAIMFGIFYYYMWIWEKRDRLMEIFCNGIILNFLYTVGYCFMHRPYMKYRFNRYAMGYHTVTMTGCYLALVLCAVTVRLFAKYQKTRRWQEVWKELSLLGIGNIYLFLTLSRTGYLAAYLMEIGLCIFMVFLWEKEKITAIFQKIGMGIAVSVLFFPIIFTAQRIMPSLFDDPIYSEIEMWEYTIEKGEPKDSQLYMDIEYFLHMASYKLFGINLEKLMAVDIQENQEIQGSILCSLLKEPEWVYVKGQSQELVLATDYIEVDSDVSNGRFDIFREYISHWNMTGHEDMWITATDGNILGHAHNSYLQVIHDHGIVTGIVFVLFGAITFFFGIYRYVKRRKRVSYNSLTFTVVFTFALASCVEWIFHICNPFGFSLFVVITPLLFTKKKTARK